MISEPSRYSGHLPSALPCISCSFALPSLPPPLPPYPPKIIHSSVVDTAIVFPHRKGPPFKRALKSLMAEHLQRFIQDSAGEEVEGREGDERSSLPPPLCSQMEVTIVWKMLALVWSSCCGRSKVTCKRLREESQSDLPHSLPPLSSPSLITLLSH